MSAGSVRRRRRASSCRWRMRPARRERQSHGRRGERVSPTPSHGRYLRLPTLLPVSPRAPAVRRRCRSEPRRGPAGAQARRSPRKRADDPRPDHAPGRRSPSPLRRPRRAGPGPPPSPASVELAGLERGVLHSGLRPGAVRPRPSSFTRSRLRPARRGRCCSSSTRGRAAGSPPRSSFPLPSAGDGSWRARTTRCRTAPSIPTSAPSRHVPRPRGAAAGRHPAHLRAGPRRRHPRLGRRPEDRPAGRRDLGRRAAARQLRARAGEVRRAEAGRTDFNHDPTRDLDALAARGRHAHRLEFFDGSRDEWISAAEAARAVAWMELVAMREQRRATDRDAAGAAPTTSRARTRSWPPTTGSAPGAGSRRPPKSAAASRTWPSPSGAPRRSPTTRWFSARSRTRTGAPPSRKPPGAASPPSTPSCARRSRCRRCSDSSGSSACPRCTRPRPCRGRAARLGGARWRSSVSSSARPLRDLFAAKDWSRALVGLELALRPLQTTPRSATTSPARRPARGAGPRRWPRCAEPSTSACPVPSRWLLDEDLAALRGDPGFDALLERARTGSSPRP